MDLHKLKPLSSFSEGMGKAFASRRSAFKSASKLLLVQARSGERFLAGFLVCNEHGLGDILTIIVLGRNISH